MKNDNFELLDTNEEILDVNELQENQEGFYILVDEFEDDIVVQKPILYKSIEDYLTKNGDLPNWRNGSTPLDELNMWRINNEINTKYDDVVLDLEKRKIIFKINGLNVKEFNLNDITENSYTTLEKQKVSKIDDIESKLNSIDFDFGTF